MYCRNCGKEIDDKAVICINCGCETKPVKRENKNVSAISALITLIIVILFIIGNLKAYQMNEQINKETGQNSTVLYKIFHEK